MAKKTAAKKAAKPAKKAAKPAPKKTVKPAPKKAAKPAAKKPAKAKPAPKKAVAKKVAKPAPKKAAKPVKKAAPQKAAVKKTVKPVVKKAAPKAAVKAAPKKSVPAKPAPKAPVAKTAAPVKAVAPPPAKKVDTKPAPKPVAPKQEKQTAPPKAKKDVKKEEKEKVTGGSKPLVTQVVAPNRPMAAPVVKKQVSTLESIDKLRYSDDELGEFKELILKKLDEARKDYDLLKQTLANTDNNGTDDTSPSFKMIEDGSETLSREETAQLASRQEKFIKHLEDALLRIRNKTYGICRVTGRLISKERLRLVPHATLSIEAKQQMSNG